LALEMLKEKLREKAVGKIADEVVEKIDELVRLQKETNKLLKQILEAVSREREA